MILHGWISVKIKQKWYLGEARKYNYMYQHNLSHTRCGLKADYWPRYSPSHGSGYLPWPYGSQISRGQ
jgi:hypothetical protein